MIELSRTDALLDTRHCVERHERIVSAAHLKPGDVGRSCALRRIEPQDHVVQLVLGREPADVTPAEQCLQSRGDFACRDAKVFCAVAVECYDQLGLGDAKIGVDVDESGNRSRDRSHERSIPRTSASKSRFCTTNCTGAPNPPNAGGLMANANTPGTPKNCGCTSSDDVLRAAITLVPVFENGSEKPRAWRTAESDDAESRSHVLRLFDDRLELPCRYPSVYATEAPSGATTKVKKNPRSSGGTNSRFEIVEEQDGAQL